MNHDTYLLKELLAVIHRDGGHYTEKHGVEKSTRDARATVLEMRSALTEIYNDGRSYSGTGEAWTAITAAQNTARQALGARSSTH